MDLSCTTSEVDGYVVLTLIGTIDVSTAPFLRDCLLDVHQNNKHRIVVDLTEVGFVDSTGLGLLVGSLKRSRANNGDVKIVGSDERVLKVFQITGLDKVFTITPTVAEAVASESR